MIEVISTKPCGTNAITLAIAATYRSQNGLQTGTIRALSYLPLAHILERAWIGYMSLVDGQVHLFFAESLETFVKDLQRARRFQKPWPDFWSGKKRG